MNHPHYIISGLAGLFIFFLASCSTGKKQLAQGDYEDAVYRAVNRLRDNQGSKKAAETLSSAYQLAVKYFTQKIRTAEASTERFKFDQMADAYQRLNRMEDEINRCPRCLELLTPKNYEADYVRVKDRAAAERFKAGEEALARNTRPDGKEAYNHFVRVEQLDPNYPQIYQKKEEALWMATLHVVVEPIPVHSRIFNLSNEFFQNKIQEYLYREPINAFVRFYTPGEAQRLKVTQPDHLVKLQFDDFVVGQTYVKETVETFTKDSIKVGEAKIGEVKQPVYGSVKATLRTFQKTVESGGRLDVQIWDAGTRRILRQDKFEGAYNWYSEWATYQGDDRALTEVQKKLCNQREVFPPPAQDLFVEFCKPIYDQVTNFMRNYYREM